MDPFFDLEANIDHFEVFDLLKVIINECSCNNQNNTLQIHLLSANVKVDFETQSPPNIIQYILQYFLNFNKKKFYRNKANCFIAILIFLPSYEWAQ